MTSNKKQAVLICVSGGSGSGKSTIADSVVKLLPKKFKSTIICQDSYYLPFKEKTLSERKKINYDHPSSYDWEMMIKQLKQLLKGKAVNTPIYDYSEYTSSLQTKKVEPVDVVIFEGLITFWKEEINKIADLKIYVDTPSDERLIRRIERDNLQRGRTIQSIIKQWRGSVRLMHRQFVEAQKEKADIIIPWYLMNNIATDTINGAIKAFVERLKKGL
ncbi:uridine kinase [[Mycoplasma] testudinis]|uniref:uridine kinase n=1 Tax=[Mycoplasma] testudinis TaxID=33924 RepID=UPI0004883CD7|nr:uridine kinase [[Mycoplasma] testudinis]